MSLTLGRGPLVAKDFPESNYEIDGPKHRILWHEFPRRVRAELAGATVFDTVSGRLLHESQMLPVLYVPEADVDFGLLEPTDHSTHCPFKGDASYWSIRVGDQVSENAVWSYLEPNDEASWLAGHYACYRGKLDAWFDEDEEIRGHLRDPFHRVDVRASSRRARALIGGEPVAITDLPMVLSETGLPNRIYFPIDDVDAGVLEPSEATAHCPYKGDATYWSVRAGDEKLEDAAFGYPEPLDGVGRVAGHVAFLHDEIDVEIEPR